MKFLKNKIKTLYIKDLTLLNRFIHNVCEDVGLWQSSLYL